MTKIMNGLEQLVLHVNQADSVFGGEQIRGRDRRNLFSDIIDDILSKNGLKFAEHQIRSIFSGDNNLYAG